MTETDEFTDETSENETVDPLINEEINIVKPGNVFKAHNGFITTANVFEWLLQSINI